MSSPSNQPFRPRLTRRRFLQFLGVAAGGLVLPTMEAWNHSVRAAREEPPTLEGRPEDVRVIVLGAGPGGLSAAYELMNAGYDVVVLEAKERVGGHVFTVRRGSTREEYGGERIVCDFDEGQFFDAGAWRIPYSHRAVLHYTKEFGIPLQPHININLNAYVYMENVDSPLSGQAIRLRQMRADMAGYTNELLAKAINQDQLDTELSADDEEALIEYLVAEGLLSQQDLSYSATSRRGYEVHPGAGMQPGEPSEPIPFQELLPFASEALSAAGYYIASVPAFDQQETMLQPVGGMSRIYEDGFQQALGDRIRLRSEVQEIRQDQDGVRIVYRNMDNNETVEISGDYCMCGIPLSVLQNIPADFPADMREAIRQVPYFSSGKIGLQMGRRFWEEEDWIYGGMSFLNIPEIDTIAYPDYNYQDSKGVIQGYYNFGQTAIEVSRLSNQERIELALRHGSKLHEQYRDAFETGFSVAWHRVPHLLGAWPHWTDRTRNQFYPRLLEPAGRIYLTGEHLSYVTAWQEGAILASWMQVDALHNRVMGGS